MKIECPCGEYVSDNAIGRHARYIKSADYNELWDRIDDAIEQSGPSSKEKEQACMDLRRSRFFHSFMQCPECKRLVFYGKGDDIFFFKPEGKAEEQLLREQMEEW